MLHWLDAFVEIFVFLVIDRPFYESNWVFNTNESTFFPLEIGTKQPFRNEIKILKTKEKSKAKKNDAENMSKQEKKIKSQKKNKNNKYLL